MKLEELQALHKALFESLCLLKKICEKHGITYYLDSGTLLGAVRHGGFIPWDDDADTTMTRENFNKFCSIAKEEMPEGYSIWFPGSNPSKNHYATPIVRICHDGTDLDIFALDYMKPNISKFTFKFIEYLDLARLNQKEKEILYKHFKKQHLKRAVIRSGNIFKLFMNEEKAEKYIFKKLTSKVPTDKYIVLGFIPSYRPVKYLGEGTAIKFETGEFNAPCNYKSLLTQLYGDYMKFPPKERRYYMIDEEERKAILAGEPD